MNRREKNKNKKPKTVAIGQKLGCLKLRLWRVCRYSRVYSWERVARVKGRATSVKEGRARN